MHVAPDAQRARPLERFDAAIDDETPIVSVPHVSYSHGHPIDVEAVAELAHERGALCCSTLSDGRLLPLDVRALGVDLLTSGALKYLLGSAGLAFMWCRADSWTRHADRTGWFADEDVAAMDAWDYSPARVATRFESGTPRCRRCMRAWRAG